MDSNAHAGPSMLPHDMLPQNQNGKLLLAFLAQHPSISVVNAMNVCEGTVTRIKETVKSVEKSTIDFYLVNSTIKPSFKKMTIDTEKEYGLTNFAQIKTNKKAIQSDHCPMKLEMNIEYSNTKPERVEHFNLRNQKCQATFKNETDKTSTFEKCFENDSPPLTQMKLWKKKFNQAIHKSFKKI